VSRLLILLALVPALVQAEMYKCVDAAGKSSYADQPGPGCKRVDIQGSPPISGRLQDGTRNTAQDEASFRQRQIARERSEELEKKAQAEQAGRCAELRQELARVNNGRRVVEKMTESGERVYMDDKTREEKIARLNADLRGCP
jgi:sRNA-binding protein